MLSNSLPLPSPQFARMVPLDWELGHENTEHTTPSVWIPAKVPSAVQLDIARAEKYEPFYYAEHWKDYRPLEDQYFTYRTAFRKPSLEHGKRLHFVSLGIDYECEIYLNDEKIFFQEGMFTPVDIDLTDKCRDTNRLLVKIHPVPKLYPAPDNRSQAAHVTKPAVSYGWDWHPRLVPLGIWDDTWLEIRPAAYINDVQTEYVLDDQMSSAQISLEMNGSNLAGNRYVWILSDASGNEVLKADGIFTENRGERRVTLNKPELWWPHDNGKPYLYSSTVTLHDATGTVLQTRKHRMGFRRVRLVMNEGAWMEPVGFPKSRSVPPMQLEINGKRIFCKGTNWVNPEIFPGSITRDRYNGLLDRAKEANFNILRVWGGGIVNKEAFYELCDEKGILVWQEFPLACNNYEGTPHYLAQLERESASIIGRVKKHPSLAVWCGGNELFNTWSGMTDQSAALRLLNSQCYRLDPTTPFLPTSPIMGVGHGNYVFRDTHTGDDVFATMNRARCTAYTEFGVPSPAPVAVLKKILPENELWPPREGTSWESHHAFKSWQENTWLCQDIIEFYFGPSGSLKELVDNGQLLQGEGYKCIYEEARRQKPYCSMAIGWCFNEPWPTAANNSLISYPDIPKPGYYAVKNACRPVLASARFTQYKWGPGGQFTAEIWMLNDLPHDTPSGRITVKIAAGKRQSTLLEWDYQRMPANTNQPGPVVRYTLPSWKVDRFRILLEDLEHPEFNSEYTLAYKAADETT